MEQYGTANEPGALSNTAALTRRGILLAMTPDADASGFAELAAQLHSAPTPVQTAEDVIDYAREHFDADYGGITLIRAKGRLQTIAPTGPLAEQADVLQYELGEGPCRDSVWHGTTLLCGDLNTDQRWPRWARKVVSLGVQSVLAVELTNSTDRRLGAINLYWSHPRTFAADDVAFANIFARHAAVALATSLHEAELNVALDGRKLIGQAQGILMERYDLDEARAFEVLKRYSQDHNIKLRRVAEILTVTRQLPAVESPGPGSIPVDSAEPT